MKPTDILMGEHRMIEHVLDALEAGAARLGRDEAIRPGFFLDVADFAAGFADGCHHRKEEGVLFPTMTRYGMSVDAGPIAVMLREHDLGRTYVRQLRAAAQQLAAGDRGAVPKVIAAARSYAGLLRDHIAKEDEVLFPMAADMLPDPVQDEIISRFDRVEHDETGHEGHAHLLDLARRLRDEAGTA